MDEHSRKRHKKNKKEKKEKKRKHNSSSSDSDDQWVEKRTEEKTKEKLSSEFVNKSNSKGENDKRDGWMSLEMDFAQFGSKKENTKEVEVKKTPEDEPGQNSRELNPYWRNGGTGLPPEKKNLDSRKDRTGSDISERRSRSISRDSENRRKDYDSSNYNRSERNREKSYENEKNRRKDYNSSEYNRSERSKDKSYDDDKNRRKDYDSLEYNRSERSREKSYGNERRNDEYRSRERRNRDEDSKSSRHREDNWASNRSNSRTFKKPNEDDDYNSYREERDRRRDRYQEDNKESTSSSSSSRKGWKKNRSSEEKSFESKPSSSKSEDQVNKLDEISSGYEMDIIEHDPQKVLTWDELNALCAKMLKAELKGKWKLARELRNQVENARKLRDKTKTNEEDAKREVIILTETDSKGFSRPLKSVREEIAKSKKKVETHEGKERVRYFADDDSLTLSEMFEKERFGSSRDQNATFMKLMGKEMSERNEDAFEETASFDDVNKKEMKDWDNAARSFTQREKAMDSCTWCLDSKNANQEVIVAIRNRVHLCVPSSQSLTEGHCIIVPSDHIPCATLLDEDVWEDIMNLRKNLVKIFEAEDEDIIFFECATNLEKYPHMLLHCVPVPKEIGDVAPIYFKKAIMECEMEWSNNKKVVDLAGRNVRKAIPKGLPYFAVDFGMQSGYAHVIEDKRLFPKNFAQEIIGGMLDIDHLKWRKLHKDSHENIQKKVEYLKQLIQKNL